MINPSSSTEYTPCSFLSWVDCRSLLLQVMTCRSEFGIRCMHTILPLPKTAASILCSSLSSDGAYNLETPSRVDLNPSRQTASLSTSNLLTQPVSITNANILAHLTATITQVSFVSQFPIAPRRKNEPDRLSCLSDLPAGTHTISSRGNSVCPHSSRVLWFQRS